MNLNVWTSILFEPLVISLFELLYAIIDYVYRLLKSETTVTASACQFYYLIYFNSICNSLITCLKRREFILISYHLNMFSCILFLQQQNQTAMLLLI